MKYFTSQALALATLSTVFFAHAASAQNTANCSEDQKGLITSAQVSIGLGLLDASNDIGAMQNGGDASKFLRWFGSTDDAIVDRVLDTLQSVYGGIDEITFNCDCTRTDAYAFVYPDDTTFQIYMCPPWFDSFRGGNLQMSTIVHEISHFLGTRDCTKPVSSGDCCYGGTNDPPGCMGADPVPSSPAAAQSLAASDPDTASTNAYNIGWFVTDGT